MNKKKSDTNTESIISIADCTNKKRKHLFLMKAVNNCIIYFFKKRKVMY